MYVNFAVCRAFPVKMWGRRWASTRREAMLRWTRIPVTPQRSRHTLTWVQQPTWWHHQMETFSALLALCAGNSPVNGEFPAHKGQWRGALMFSLICAWMNDWVNNREAGDLRRHHAHYDATLMEKGNTLGSIWIGHRSGVTSDWCQIVVNPRACAVCEVVVAHSN